MFTYENKGIRITGSNLWLDAERKVEFSFISHGHADHIKNHQKILATPATARFFTKRIGHSDSVILDYGERFNLDGMGLRLYPAGHVLGSAMILIEKDGGKLLYSGDFKMQAGWTAEPIQIPQADILIMESTFGSPEYRFNGARETLLDELVGFVDETSRWNSTPVVMAYALGKAQEAMKVLGDYGYRIKVYRTAWEMAQIYQDFGIEFQNCRLWSGEELGRNDVLIIPPHVRKTKAVQSLASQRTVMLSGWAKSDSARFRFGADKVIALSDHADFDELIEFVHQVSPQKIYCTHGADDFPHYLRKIGFDAELLKSKDQLAFL